MDQQHFDQLVKGVHEMKHHIAGVTEVITIRPAEADDKEGMRTLLNEIIRVGGTTAITNELSPDEMRE